MRRRLLNTRWGGGGAAAEQHVDPPLTDLGRRQAASWHTAVPALRIERAYVSPLWRALQTAAIVFEQATNTTALVVTRLAREHYWRLARDPPARVPCGVALLLGVGGVAAHRTVPRGGVAPARRARAPPPPRPGVH